MKNNQTRCAWCLSDNQYIAYHDTVWGVPVCDSQQLFSMLNLEGMQAGLSWLTILKRIDGICEAFDDFVADKIISYDEIKIKDLKQNEKIIRSETKIRAVVGNAKAFIKLQQQQKFSDYIWQFTDGKVLQNNVSDFKDIPVSTDISTKMAKDLKQKGFKFVGPVICYAFMQAVGMVNDHMTDCFRHPQLSDDS